MDMLAIAARGAARGGMEPCQVWMGNLPFGLGEREVEAQLQAYGLHPMKCVVRHRQQGQDGFCICTFASQPLAEKALNTECVWANGRHLMRSPFGRDVLCFCSRLI